MRWLLRILQGILTIRLICCVFSANAMIDQDWFKEFRRCVDTDDIQGITTIIGNIHDASEFNREYTYEYFNDRNLNAYIYDYQTEAFQHQEETEHVVRVSLKASPVTYVLAKYMFVSQQGLIKRRSTMLDIVRLLIVRGANGGRSSQHALWCAWKYQDHEAVKFFIAHRFFGDDVATTMQAFVTMVSEWRNSFAQIGTYSLEMLTLADIITRNPKNFPQCIGDQLQAKHVFQEFRQLVDNHDLQGIARIIGNVSNRTQFLNTSFTIQYCGNKMTSYTYDHQKEAFANACTRGYQVKRCTMFPIEYVLNKYVTAIDRKNTNNTISFFEMIRLLIAHGAQLRLVSDNTPLYVAWDNGDHAAVKLFLANQFFGDNYDDCLNRLMHAALTKEKIFDTPFYITSNAMRALADTIVNNQDNFSEIFAREIAQQGQVQPSVSPAGTLVHPNTHQPLGNNQVIPVQSAVQQVQLPTSSAIANSCSLKTRYVISAVLATIVLGVCVKQLYAWHYPADNNEQEVDDAVIGDSRPLEV